MTDPSTEPPAGADAAPPPAEHVPALPVDVSVPAPDDYELEPLEDEAAVRAAALRRQNRIAALGLGAVALVIAIGAGIAIGRGLGSSTPAQSLLLPLPTSTTAAGVASASPDAAASPAGSGIAGLPSDGPRLGTADAPVTIQYWADYQCPYCARFAGTVLPQLEGLIADGTLSILHRDDAFIGEESIDAAVAVRCAGRQGLYWPMHDAVYASQQGENQGGFVRARLVQIAASVGADTTALTACLDDPEPLLDVLDDTAAAIRAGVQSTPTLDVNGTRMVGVPELSALTAAIQAAKAGTASPAPLPTEPPLPDDWATVPTSGRTAGSASAPATVELWMDYQATGSPAIVTDLEPGLRSRVAKGAIEVVQRDLATLGDESVAAAATVRCVAEQGGPAWLTSDILASAAQGKGQGIFVTANLLRLVAKMGLQVRTFDACLSRPDVAAAIQAETAQGVGDGLTAAPAVVVRSGNREVARFTGSIDAAAVLKAIDAATK